jgi:hypothetical protein
LIFDQNKEKLQMAASSDESREKTKTLPDTSSSDPEEPDKKLPEPLPSKPIAAAIPPAEPMQTATGGSPLQAAEKPVPAPAVGPKTPVGQAKSVPAGISSTDSLVKKILPDGKSKTIPDASAAKKNSKKIIAVGGAKGGSANPCFPRIWLWVWLF